MQYEQLNCLDSDDDIFCLLVSSSLGFVDVVRFRGEVTTTDLSFGGLPLLAGNGVVTVADFLKWWSIFVCVLLGLNGVAFAVFALLLRLLCFYFVSFYICCMFASTLL